MPESRTLSFPEPCLTAVETRNTDACFRQLSLDRIYLRTEVSLASFLFCGISESTASAAEAPEHRREKLGADLIKLNEGSRNRTAQDTITERSVEKCNANVASAMPLRDPKSIKPQVGEGRIKC
jgi:hypothetical protein